MSKTIVDVLVEIGYAVELSSLKETRGIYSHGKNIVLNGKSFDGSGIDVSGSVFYKCVLAAQTVPGVVLIDCKTTHDKHPKFKFPDEFGYVCREACVSLENIDFLSADLRNVDLSFTKLQGAHLQNANLQGANLQYAKLEGAKLRRADLRRAHLQNANLQKANLLAANLQSANLKDTNLEDADLRGAKLEGAYLRGANLHGANLQDVLIDSCLRRTALLYQTF